MQRYVGNNLGIAFCSTLHGYALQVMLFVVAKYTMRDIVNISSYIRTYIQLIKNIVEWIIGIYCKLLP